MKHKNKDDLHYNSIIDQSRGRMQRHADTGIKNYNSVPYTPKIPFQNEKKVKKREKYISSRV